MIQDWTGLLVHQEALVLRYARTTPRTVRNFTEKISVVKTHNLFSQDPHQFLLTVIPSYIYLYFAPVGSKHKTKKKIIKIERAVRSRPYLIPPMIVLESV
jgi:hypothetical protein